MNLWKYLLILSQDSKTKERGFTIPLILGFGLFMILTAITAIKLSSSSETSSKIQETSNQALAAAEVGLSRFQSLIDQAREVSVYPDCVSARNSSGVCPDSGTAASWSNTAAILTETSTTICGNSTTARTLTLIQNLASSTEWQDVSNNPEDGQFRLVSYTFQNFKTAKKPPGIGTLVVEGRTSQGVANATKTSTKAMNTGIARLKAEIPINENPKTYTSSVPGLWMKYSNATSMGNDKINGDILIEGCLVPGGVSTANLFDPTTQKISSNPDPMPDTPPITGLLNNNSTAWNYLIGDGVPSQDNTPANDPVITNAFAVGTFPRTGDDPAPDGRYHYLIQNLDSNGGSDIQIAAGANVVFYVQGNISLGGSLTLNAQSNGNTPTNLQIYGNTTVATGTGLKNSNFKYGCPGGGTCPTTQVFFNGTGEIKALIHAPQAVAGVAGGGNANGQVKGTIWVNGWDALSMNAKVKVDAVGQLSDMLSVSQTNKIEPQITVTSNWTRQEVPQ